MRSATTSSTVALSLILAAALVPASRVSPARAGGGPQHRLDVRPVEGPIISMYGYRVNPLSETREKQFHYGVDMHATEGEPVRAASLGVVIKAGNIGGYGNAVHILHINGLETRYGHLAGIQVTAGQLVVAGDQIGTAGSTGMSVGPHLHFEVLDALGALDPIDELPDTRTLRTHQPSI